MRGLLVTMFAMLGAFAAPPAMACTSSFMGDPATLIRDADVIVRMRAVSQRGEPFANSLTLRRQQAESSGRQFGTDIRFEVIEVIKGLPAALVADVEGTLEDRDDPNDRPVPYGWVRPGGRGGGCFAMRYRLEREYLLFLKTVRGRQTPYWSPMAPTNEQVSGANDPWVAWVRQRLRVW